MYNATVTSDTVLSFRSQGISPAAWKNFKAGKFILHNRLDLHGLTRDEAYQYLEKFMIQNTKNEYKFGLIIHGKGGKYHEPPIIKNLVYNWLCGHQEIIAYHSAINKHGGTGAVYIWLKSQ